MTVPFPLFLQAKTLDFVPHAILTDSISEPWEAEMTSRPVIECLRGCHPGQLVPGHHAFALDLDGNTRTNLFFLPAIWRKSHPMELGFGEHQ